MDFTVDGSVTMCNIVYDNVVVNVSGSASPTPIPTPTVGPGGVVTPGASTLPDTGQDYDYTVIFGEDSDYTINPPSYTDNGDLTITDNVTGLMRQQKDLPWGIVNGYKAMGITHATYNNSGDHVCGQLGLGGYTDWRLPTIHELYSLSWLQVDALNAQYQLHPAYFPDETAALNTGNYWSTTWKSNSLYVLEVQTGDTRVEELEGGALVRCVRG